jgi:hypothetical protein
LTLCFEHRPLKDWGDALWRHAGCYRVLDRLIMNTCSRFAARAAGSTNPAKPSKSKGPEAAAANPTHITPPGLVYFEVIAALSTLKRPPGEVGSSVRVEVHIPSMQ